MKKKMWLARLVPRFLIVTILASLLLVALPAQAADNISVSFEKIRESPVDVTFRVTVMGNTGNYPVKIEFSDLSIPVKVVEVAEAKTTPYIKDVPVYGLRDTTVADILGGDDTGKVAEELKALDTKTTVKVLKSNISGKSFAVSKEVEDIINQYPDKINDILFYNQVTEYKKDLTPVTVTNRQFTAKVRSTKVYEVTIKTGEAWRGNGYGSKGVLILDINGKKYYDMTHSSWWDATWNLRNVLSFNASTITANLTDFAVRVHITNTKFDFTHIEAGGADIRFVDKDDTTSLPYEIEYWDDTLGAEDAVVWVKIPQVDGLSSYSDYFYIYYDKVGAVDAQNKNTVWGGYSVINNCEATDDWTGTTLSLDNADFKEGANSLKDNVAVPVGGTEYITTYNPAGVWDLSRMSTNLDFWLKSNRISTAYTWARLYITDSSGNYDYWNLTFAANTWTNIVRTVGNAPDGNGGVAADLTQITSISVDFKAADVTTFWKKIDWIENRWGAVGVWHFAEMAGVNAGDSTRYTNNGTITNATWNNYALSFDGTDDVVNCGSAASLDALTGNMTVEVWINPTSLGEGNQGRIVVKGTLIKLSMYSTATAFFQLYNGAYKTATAANNSVPFGSWTHVVGVYNNSNVLIYTNLTLVTGSAMTGNVNDHSVTSLLVGDNIASDLCFNGLIDEPRAYNYARNASEVRGDNMNRLDTLLYYGNEDPPPTLTTLDAVSIAIDKDGVTSGLFSGNLTSLGGAPTVDYWWDYGLTIPYSDSTIITTNDTIGVKNLLLPPTLTPGQTYHFRFVAMNTDGTTNGTDKQFTLTMPTIVTNDATNVAMSASGTFARLNGQINTMGVASSAYAYFQWSYDYSYSNSTALQTVGLGTYDALLTGYDPNQAIHYRGVGRIGGVYFYGSDITFNTTATTSYNLNSLILVVFSAFMLFVVIKIMVVSDNIILGIILIAIAIYIGNSFLQGMATLLSNLW